MTWANTHDTMLNETKTILGKCMYSMIAILKYLYTLCFTYSYISICLGEKKRLEENTPKHEQLFLC